MAKFIIKSDFLTCKNSKLTLEKIDDEYFINCGVLNDDGVTILQANNILFPSTKCLYAKIRPRTIIRLKNAYNTTPMSYASGDDVDFIDLLYSNKEHILGVDHCFINFFESVYSTQHPYSVFNSTLVDEVSFTLSDDLLNEVMGFDHDETDDNGDSITAEDIADFFGVPRKIVVKHGSSKPIGKVKNSAITIDGDSTCAFFDIDLFDE